MFGKLRKILVFSSLAIFLVAGVFLLTNLSKEDITGYVSIKDILVPSDNGVKMDEVALNELRTTDHSLSVGKVTKEYKSKEKRVVMESDSGEVMLDLKLESDYTEAVLSGKDALIAWFFLEDYAGENFVDDVKFYDVKNNYEELNKNYTFKYKTVENVSICDEFGKNCETTEEDVWVRFDSLGELPGGSVEVGLFMDINPGEEIEWIIEKDGFDFLEWAVVKGTSAGFVSVAPTADPGGSGVTIDAYTRAAKFTSPSDAIAITEIGWWASASTGESITEVGIYSHNSGTDYPDALLVNKSFAKGTSSGWKSTSVDLAISPNTIYWIAVQLDNTAIATRIDRSPATGETYRYIVGQTALQDPFVSGATTTNDYIMALYAVYETNTCNCPNISSSGESQTQIDSYSALNFGGTIYGAQTFTIGNVSVNGDFNITSVKLQMWRDVSPGTITASIRNVDGNGKPTGGDLSSGTTDGDTLTSTNAGEWREISMSPYILNASTQYALVFKAQYSQAVSRGGTSSPYSGGERYSSSDSGSSWSAVGDDIDSGFEIIGTFLGANWEVNMSENCELNQTCDLGTGELTFTGSGYANCSAEINTTNMGTPGSGEILYVSNGCKINMG